MQKFLPYWRLPSNLPGRRNASMPAELFQMAMDRYKRPPRGLHMHQCLHQLKNLSGQVDGSSWVNTACPFQVIKWSRKLQSAWEVSVIVFLGRAAEALTPSLLEAKVLDIVNGNKSHKMVLSATFAASAQVLCAIALWIWPPPAPAYHLILFS